jgi:hypothetical protein
VSAQRLFAARGIRISGGYERLCFVTEDDCVSFVVTGGKNAPK